MRLQASAYEKDLPPLTQAQRDALDEAIAHQEAHSEEGTPWREALERIRRRVGRPD